MASDKKKIGWSTTGHGDMMCVQVDVVASI